jgi:actin-related protein
MDTILIDYGSNSVKFGRKKDNVNSSLKVFGYEPNEIDLSITVQQKYPYWEKVDAGANGSSLRDLLKLQKNENRNFLLSQHMDSEFKKNNFIQKSFETLFEVENFQGGQIILQPILVFLALNDDATKSNMLIVDSGEESTYIIPIYDQFILRDCIERSFLGGGILSSRFEYAISQTSSENLDSLTKLDFQLMKEKSLKVCPNFSRYNKSVLRNENFYVQNLTLPDGKHIKIGKDAYEIPEILFSPANFGYDGKGVVEKLFNSVKVK